MSNRWLRFSTPLINILKLIANDLDTDEEVEIPYMKFRFR